MKKGYIYSIPTLIFSCPSLFGTLVSGACFWNRFHRVLQEKNLSFRWPHCKRYGRLGKLPSSPSQCCDWITEWSFPALSLPLLDIRLLKSSGWFTQPTDLANRESHKARVEYFWDQNNIKNNCNLKLTDLQVKESTEYKVRIITDNDRWLSRGVELSVTGKCHNVCFQ